MQDTMGVYTDVFRRYFGETKMLENQYKETLYAI